MKQKKLHLFTFDEKGHAQLSHLKLSQHIEQEVEQKMHVNLYEHRENFFKFLINVTSYALLGVVAGGIVEKVSQNIQGDKDSRGDCALFLVGQLVFVSLLFFALLHVPFIYPVFDDWMMGTFAGFLFALTFFAAQPSLSTNMTCVFQ